MFFGYLATAMVHTGNFKATFIGQILAQGHWYLFIYLPFLLIGIIWDSLAF